MKKFISLLLLSFTLTGCGKSWDIVGESGNIKLIEVAESINDKAFFRDAIPKICSKDENCQLIFWKKGNAPSSLPLSDTDIQSIMVYYANQVTPKKQNLRWNCEIFPNTSKSICLDTEFIRNAIR